MRKQWIPGPFLRMGLGTRLLRDVYNHFCHSAKCQEEFRAIQSFIDVEPHKLLRPCQTRLSLQSCVSRLVEQWDAHRQNLLVSQKILSHLQNPIRKLYFYFLDFVLPKFTELKVMFQSAKTSVHCFHNGLHAIYRDFLSCYLHDSHTPLQHVDPTSQVNFLPLTSMYTGAKVALRLPTQEYRQRAPEVATAFFEACTKILY